MADHVIFGILDEDSEYEVYEDMNLALIQGGDHDGEWQVYQDDRMVTPGGYDLLLEQDRTLSNEQRAHMLALYQMHYLIGKGRD